MPNRATSIQQALDGAHEALDAGDLLRAHREAERVLALAPDLPAGLLVQAAIARAEGHLDQASRLYAHALAQPLEAAEAWLAHANYAELLLAQGAPRDALPHARQAIEREPEEMDAYLAAARAFVALGQPHNARLLLDEVLAFDEALVEALVMRGELLAARRAWGEARDDFARAIDLEPDEPRHYLAYAEAAVQGRDPDAALATLEEGLAQVPAAAAPPLRERRALLLLALGELEEGLRETEALLAQGAPSPSLLLARAETRLDNDDAEGALSDLDALLAHDPDHEEAQRGRLDALLALGRWAEASDLLDRLLARAPSTDLLNLRGDLFWELDQLDEARAAYEQVLAQEPEHPLASYNLGLLRLEQGAPHEALPLLDRAVEVDPTDEERLRARSEALLAVGLPYQAWLDADRALQGDDEFIEGFLARAEAAVALNKPGEALDDLDAALALYPTFGEALAARARLLAAEGKTIAARTDWESYLALPAEEQDAATVAEAQEALKR